MARHTLYAYADGADLEGIAATLEARFEEFVASRNWIAGRAWVVNQRHGIESCTQPGDLEPWDLGLNLELPEPGKESPGWFSDIQATAEFLAKLHSEFGRDFVIGIADAKTSVSEELFDVSTSPPDLLRLKAIIGVGDVE
jgi:hypothetical protein